jgi:hypothetical protein
VNSLIRRAALLDARRLMPVATWAGYLGLAGWSWAVLLRADIHPNPWPCLVLLAVLLCGAIASVFRVLLSVIFRRDVWGNFRAFCRAMLPLWLLAGHLGILYAETLHRRVEISPVSLSMLPLVIACGEAESWFRYSMRTEGEFVVLYHSGIDRAAERVAAADQYLRELQKILGTPARIRLRWVKGSLLGRQGFSFGAFALTAPRTEDLIDPLDRHELAHAMINQFMSHRMRTPMVLIEGWAEAVSSTNPDELHSAAAHDLDLPGGLVELMLPDWAPIDAGPVYTTGGSFVRQLLDEYGGEKFLQLYLTCRPHTSRADFERIYGTSLEDFERRYREKLAGCVFEQRRRTLLTMLPTADAVDGAAWRKFVDDYLGPAGQRPFPHDFDLNVRTIWEPHSEPAVAKRTMVTRLAKQGDTRLMITDTDLLAISSSDAVLLARQDSEHPWTLQSGCSAKDKLQFWMMHQRFRNFGLVTLDPVISDSQIDRWEHQRPRVMTFERAGQHGAETVTVRLESSIVPSGEVPFETEWEFHSHPVWHLTASSTKQFIKDAHSDRSHFEYEFAAGSITRRMAQADYFNQQGTLASTYRSEIDVDPNPHLHDADLQAATYGVTSDSSRSFTAMGWAKTAYISVAVIMGFLSLPQRRKHAAR